MTAGKPDGSGLLTSVGVPLANGAKIISASGTVRGLGGRNRRYEVVMRYRSPADVRAIPNAQWERWFRGDEPFPGTEFSSDFATQYTVRTILSATERRLNLRRGRPRKPRPNDLRVVNERLQEAYRLFAQRMKERGFVDLEEMDG